MKRIISLLVCLMLVLSFSACGKKSDNGKTSDESINTEQKADSENKTKEEENSDNKADNAELDGEASSEVKQLPVDSAKQLENMVNEFNSTDDPERKEELRKQLEEILKQAEQLSEQD